MSQIERVSLGSASELRLGEVRFVAYAGPPPWRSILVTRSKFGVHAYWNICQHLPVPLDAGTGALLPGDELVCLTHGARFRPDSGLCVAGPCKGRKLFSLEVEVDSDRIIAAIDRARLA